MATMMAAGASLDLAGSLPSLGIADHNAWAGSLRAKALRMSTNSASLHSDIPKLEDFSQGRINRGMQEPSLLEKAEHALADECSLREGDDAYKCWEALFEFEHLKKQEKDSEKTDKPLHRLENLVRQSGGVSMLIDNLSMIIAAAAAAAAKKKIDNGLEDDGDKIMKDSPFTRLLRRRGCFPSWFTPPPLHETD